jgi:hypothetical protein
MKKPKKTTTTSSITPKMKTRTLISYLRKTTIQIMLKVKAPLMKKVVKKKRKRRYLTPKLKMLILE